jgi:hypothetical protein
MMGIRSTKVCAGLYKVTDGVNTVTIMCADEGSWQGLWVASADWDRHRLTDPLDTKREAMANAVAMLKKPRF